jgi:tetratricopeptide (TPR) repeat protein
MPIDPVVNAAIESVCGHLAQRTANLFLGAGVNYGTTNPNGISFPLGADLATAICRDLLNLPQGGIGLDEAAEIARYTLGEPALNQYLYTLFESFKPNNAHLSIVQLPWDTIYTTNYDTLIEKAADMPRIRMAGVIAPVFSATKDVTEFTEDHILYYKLHGCIASANALDGRLILTKEDYRHYELNRKPLFQRLQRDLLRKTFVFVGYSFADANFRGILDDCREELGIKQFPLSYAVRRNFTPVEATFWREKYNIQLLDIDGFELLLALKDSWLSEQRKVVSFDERRRTLFADVDQSARFPKVGESFYRVVPSDCSGASEPKRFYRGAEVSWADIRDGVAATRDKYVSLMEGLFADFSDPAAPITAYLVIGHAGTGKTTMIRTAAYEAAKDYDLTVLVHIPDTPLDARLLAPFIDRDNLQRIVVVIHHAGDYLRELNAFVEDARGRKLPVSLILEERRNQWKMKITSAGDLGKRISPAEIDLGELSEREIQHILVRLEETQCLGRLAGTPTEHRQEHFLALAQKELLVALRELTTEGTFDEIIRDEFNKIDSETARRAYVYVSAIGQIHLGIRYEILARILQISSSSLGKEVFRPTDGVLISGEAIGSSRHNVGFRLTTRHPIIASIIFAHAAQDDEEKFKIIKDLISHLDPGFPEDRRLLDGIVKRKELVNTFADLDRRRELYDMLQRILPNSPHVLQHRSILERDLHHADNSIAFARQAVALDRRNPAFLNTLGLALEFAARGMKHLERRRLLVKEAGRIFDDGIARNPSDAYSYLGKFNIIRYHALELEPSADERNRLKADALSLLEEASEATGDSEIIAVALADQRRQMGDFQDAVKMLTAALNTKPENARLRDLLVRYLSSASRYKEALKIALAGIKFDPNSWRLQRHVARLMRANGYKLAPIRGAYEAAVRHNKGDLGLLVEFAAFLFTHSIVADAGDIFGEAKRLKTLSDKRQIREWWCDEGNKRKIFTGKLKRFQGATGYAEAFPENFEAFFWRTEAWIAELREGDPVQFQVGFNAYGPVAKILLQNRR